MAFNEILEKLMLSHGVKLSKNTPINVWNSPSQKTRFREIYKRLQKQDHMIVKTWEKKVQVISKKMGRGMLPSVEEKEVLNIDKLRQNFNTYLPVNSSWIKAARYSDKKKELTLKLSGRKIKPYTFYNVPYWVWAYLTTLKGHAGKKFWDENFGILYSNNPSRWFKFIK